jgi:ribonuclease-3
MMMTTNETTTLMMASTDPTWQDDDEVFFANFEVEAISTDRLAEIDQLLQSLHAKPTNHPQVYHMALTHSSYTYENKLSPLCNFERLEFLGDAVLKLTVSQLLYERFPTYREGELTKIRSVIVSDAVLAKVAEKLGLGQYIVFGISEARSGGAKKQSSLACALESLLGAFYLDGQFDTCQRLLGNVLDEEITVIDLSKTKDNFKAVLQEHTQAENLGLPAYKTLEEKGPPHNKTFVIECWVNEEIVGVGRGKSKKQAQQDAAKRALITLNVLPTQGEER